jgi:hypothetical protein
MMVGRSGFCRKLLLKESEKIVVCKLRERGSMREVPERRILAELHVGRI